MTELTGMKPYVSLLCVVNSYFPLIVGHSNAKGKMKFIFKGYAKI